MEKAPHKSQKKTINSRLLFLSVFFLHYFLLIFISTHYLYICNILLLLLLLALLLVKWEKPQPFCDLCFDSRCFCPIFFLYLFFIVIVVAIISLHCIDSFDSFFFYYMLDQSIKWGTHTPRIAKNFKGNKNCSESTCVSSFLMQRSFVCLYDNESVL